MGVNWSQIRDNAIVFQDRWKDASGNERSEAQTFVYELLRDVYGVDPRRVATFEQKVHPTTDTNGYIDMFWPGRILIEMKSKGRSLDKAHDQARKYAFAIPNDDDLPLVIMVCDFFNIRIYNLLTNQVVEFKTCNLSDNVHHLDVLTDQVAQVGLVTDKELNTQAAYKMAKLHDKLKENRYAGHDLEVYLVRILFCLFADNTGIFNKSQFHKYILSSKADGSDLAGKITMLFEVLNTPREERMATLAPELLDFPYVDGKLFEDTIRSASFDASMRSLLLECCEFDWSTISPAIFGAMFQSVMDPAKRTALGEQYTPQYIIQKMLKPLMINDLYAEFEACKNHPVMLEAFHQKLASTRILDPACGCGNFLVVAYMLLRRLEIEVIRAKYPKNEDLPESFILNNEIIVNVNQFYGFDIEDFPCQIAIAGMWLIDHKMNVEAAKEFGRPFIRIPLSEKANIFNLDALKTDWASIVDKKKITYIVGNPPFIGAKKPDYPREDMRRLFAEYPNAGLLDAVAGWYLCAAKYMQGTPIKAAFVSTNSIVQGEQVSALWEPLIKSLNIEIIFGYRPFKWTNEARDMAIVHCVIIGFQAFHSDCDKFIFDSDGVPQKHDLINPYLDGLPEITFLHRRNTPLCAVPEIGIGNKPIDGGKYLFTKEQKDVFIQEEPASEKWFREWYGAEEFLSKKPRYCLWLGDCEPDELARMPKALERVDAVRRFRQRSRSSGTRALASRPLRFHVENMPSVPYLVIPEVSGENRDYIPMGFMAPTVLCSNLVKLMPGATLYHFGILTSSVHMIWTRAVCGRLEERYRYSEKIVFNNFPWPTVNERQRQKVVSLAQAIIDIRDKYPNTTYKVLYNKQTMPDDLQAAHEALDKYVKRLYGLSAGSSDQECMIALYEKYRKLTNQV
jgi:hypothetical protein